MGRVARIMVLALVVVQAGLVAQPAWAAPPLPVQHGRHRRLDHSRL